MKYICNYFIVILIAIPFLGFGQFPRIDSYKMLKNRKDIEVNTIFQCNKGFLWVGTNEGLIQFDGVSFTLYTTKDSLASNSIVSINQDWENIIWIGHKNGTITLHDYHQFWAFNPEEGLSSKQISSFFIDNKGNLWFSTFSEGVYYYTGSLRKRLYNLNTDDGLIDDNVYTIEQDSNGLYYFGTDFGISIYDASKKTFTDEITMADGLPDNIVKKLFVQGNNLWIGMDEGGICKMNLSTNHFSHINSWEFGSLNNFVCLNENEIWISTARKGIIKCNYDMDGKSWYSLYNKDIGLSDIRTNTVYLDREKNIWFGTKKGLSVRKNNNIEFLDEKSNISFTNTFSITIDTLGKIWIAAQEGLFVLQRDEMGKIYQTRIFEFSKFSETSFISLYTDTHGNIWAGTYGFGVFKINPVTFKYQQYNTQNGLANDNVISITGDDNNLWIATLGGGLSKYCFNREDACFKSFTVENGLTSNYVYSIFIDSESITWVATDGGGVYKIIDDSIHQFQHPLLDSVGKIVYSVCEDGFKNKWFSVADQGLVMIGSDTALHLRETEGLKSNTIQSIGMNAQGNLILVSNMGIQLYYVNTGMLESYGESEGVAYLDPNLNAIFSDKEKNSWIGTAQGIVKLTGKDTSLQIKPKISIISKSLFFNELKNNLTKFKYNQNHLTFRYNAFWYQASEELSYRYKLTGYDLDWSPQTNSKMQTYSNLPAGNYVFNVEVKHPNGTWYGSPEAKYAFTIRPPFWKTTWFIIGMIIFILVAIYLFIQARTRKLLKDKEILEEEVIKRTAEIQKQKEEIEAQRDEIEAQRNHVIEQRDKIEIQNKDITASIQYASRIQKAVLPPLHNFKSLLGESFVFFKPRDIVSGDFYYLNAKNNMVIVAAADCTGHGVPGAFMSILGISLLNQIIGQAQGDFSAGYILTELRTEIKKALRQTGKDGEAKDGMDISLCVFNRDSSTMQFAGAFNPLVLVRNKELLVYKADKMPIGVFIKEDDHFSNQMIDIEPSDMLFLYSDGFQDQFGGDSKRKFLPKRLKNLLIENSHLPLEEQKNHLESAFNAWKGDLVQIDDVLVMGIRI